MTSNKIKNEHLLPVVILDMISNYQKSSDSTNEKYALFQRLDAIREALNQVLNKK